MGRKQELQHQAQRHALYGDFMERVVKMTKVLQGFLDERNMWLNLSVENLSETHSTSLHVNSCSSQTITDLFAALKALLLNTFLHTTPSAWCKYFVTEKWHWGPKLILKLLVICHLKSWLILSLDDGLNNRHNHSIYGFALWNSAFTFCGDTFNVCVCVFVCVTVWRGAVVHGSSRESSPP